MIKRQMILDWGKYSDLILCCGFTLSGLLFIQISKVTFKYLYVNSCIMVCSAVIMFYLFENIFVGLVIICISYAGMRALDREFIALYSYQTIAWEV